MQNGMFFHKWLAVGFIASHAPDYMPRELQEKQQPANQTPSFAYVVAITRSYHNRILAIVVKVWEATQMETE